MDFDPMTAADLSAVPQPVAAPLTSAAIFLVVTVNPGAENEAAVRGFCPDLAALLRTVGFREPAARLSCVMAIGALAWDRLFGAVRPAELRVFREIRSATRFGCAVAGLSVTRAGTAPSMPTLAEVEALMARA